jgi:putative drug exporter of the RND superfamily
MLGALGRFTVRRRRWVLTGTLLAVVAAGVLGGGVFGRLSGGGFSDTDAQSSRGAIQLEEVFDAADPNLVLLVTAKGGSVDDPSVAAEGTTLTRELAREPSVQQASSYWTLRPLPRCAATTDARRWCWPASTATRIRSTRPSRSFPPGTPAALTW